MRTATITKFARALAAALNDLAANADADAMQAKDDAAQLAADIRHARRLAENGFDLPRAWKDAIGS